MTSAMRPSLSWENAPDRWLIPRPPMSRPPLRRWISFGPDPEPHPRRPSLPLVKVVHLCEYDRGRSGHHGRPLHTELRGPQGDDGHEHHHDHHETDEDLDQHGALSPINSSPI